MVYSYLILLINLIKISPASQMKKNIDKLLLLQLLFISPVSESPEISLVGLLPLIFLIIMLLVFITLSSVIIWKKTMTKYDFHKQLTKNLNLIVVFIIVINLIVSSYLNQKLPLAGDCVINNEKLFINYIIAGFFCLFLIVSWEYFDKHKAEISIEFPILFLISYVAMFMLTCTKDLFVWFLCLELMSFSFYTLAGYRSSRFFLQTEGSLKYFIIGSIASSLFIFGLSLIYISFGNLSFDGLLTLYYFSNWSSEPLAFFGMLLLFIAIAFKLGIAPFHLWLPEVYYCSSSIVTFFFLLVPKLPLVYLLQQLAKFNVSLDFSNFFFLIYFLTFLIGSLSSFRQKSLDKFLAYSSIANNAWILLILGNKGDLTFLWFYMVVSSIITVLIYLPIITLRKADNTRLLINLRDLLVLKKTNFTLSILLAMSFFSLAGIPPFLGFFSKFFLLLSAIDQGLYTWVLLAILFSVFSCYYYIRMVKIMYFSNHLKTSYQKPLKLHTSLTISILSMINLFFIFFPKTILLFFYFYF